MEAVIIVAVFVAFFLPVGHLRPDALADFERLARSEGIEVYVVDTQGLERLGRLAGADGSGLQLRVPAGQITMAKAQVAEVDRRRDSSLDGTVKGLILGAVLSAIFIGDSPKLWWRGALVYGGLGYILDASVRAREPLYRVRRGPTVTVSW